MHAEGDSEALIFAKCQSSYAAGYGGVKVFLGTDLSPGIVWVAWRFSWQDEPTQEQWFSSGEGAEAHPYSDIHNLFITAEDGTLYVQIADKSLAFAMTGAAEKYSSSKYGPCVLDHLGPENYRSAEPKEEPAPTAMSDARGFSITGTGYDLVAYDVEPGTYGCEAEVSNNLRSSTGRNFVVWIDEVLIVNEIGTTASGGLGIEFKPEGGSYYGLDEAPAKGYVRVQAFGDGDWVVSCW